MQFSHLVLQAAGMQPAGFMAVLFSNTKQTQLVLPEEVCPRVLTGAKDEGLLLKEGTA